MTLTENFFWGVSRSQKSGVGGTPSGVWGVCLDACWPDRGGDQPAQIGVGATEGGGEGVSEEVKSEPVDFVESAKEPLCTRRPSKSDIESHIFGNAVVESFLSLPTWRTGEDKEGEEGCRKEMPELWSHTVSPEVGLCQCHTRCRRNTRLIMGTELTD